MKIYQVDAFTHEIFKGNPAGVCVLPGDNEPGDTLLQKIAAEMNLSETAFLSKQNGEYQLRWFTPEIEVDLCGHATLSSAHILWERGFEDPGSNITFNTLSGKLFAKKIDDKIELNFPVFNLEKIEQDKKLNASLGINPVFTGRDSKRYLLEIGDHGALLEMNPDFLALKEFGETAFIITCRSPINEYDFYSRFFAPYAGINEDPVTGTAHSYLAPYWGEKLNKRRLNAYQASRRGGEMECELTGDNRVLLRGEAVTVFEIRGNI